MGCSKEYYCDTCKKIKSVRELVPYRIDADKLAPADDTAENHICFVCLSSFQAFVKVCGAGFECKGGPGCGSDHK